MSSWWHGGPRIQGDWVLPPYLTGNCRSGDDDFNHVVFVTSERSLALNYAISCGGWLYEVEPMLPMVPDPCPTLMPGAAWVCESAHILRRFRPSRADVAQRLPLLRSLGVTA